MRNLLRDMGHGLKATQLRRERTTQCDLILDLDAGMEKSITGPARCDYQVSVNFLIVTMVLGLS